MLLGFYL